MTDGKPERIVDASKYHVEDYDTTFCLEINSVQDVDAGVYVVKAENDAGDVEAEFKVIVQRKPILS